MASLLLGGLTAINGDGCFLSERVLCLRNWKRGATSSRELSFLACMGRGCYDHSQISLLWTPSGQNEVSVLERCPYWRGHYDDVTFKPL